MFSAKARGRQSPAKGAQAAGSHCQPGRCFPTTLTPSGSPGAKESQVFEFFPFKFFLSNFYQLSNSCSL